MTKDHNEECKKNNIIISNYEDNTIHNYEEYLKQCRLFMDSFEIYNKKEYRLQLLDIYNKEKYIFQLKDYSRWRKDVKEPTLNTGSSPLVY